ncbi:hypothetical protein [Streptomyces lavendulae]|uniref:hypothetical protein n=1 Tax=Streptomyces lavendulae TaxID=1914 RepID=UPI003819E5E4
MPNVDHVLADGTSVTAAALGLSSALEEYALNQNSTTYFALHTEAILVREHAVALVTALES